MSGKTISQSETRIEALRFQSSAYGVVVPRVFGVGRVAGNLVDYLGFKAVPHTSTQGGKGGGVKVQNTTFTYQADVLMLLCQGPVSEVPRIKRGKNVFSGGWLAEQLLQATETFTAPASGDMHYTVAHAATFLVVNTVQYTLASGQVAGLAAGSDFTFDADGQVTLLTSRVRGRPVHVAYTYTTGGQPETAMERLGLTLKTGHIGQEAWSALPVGRNAPYSGMALVAGLAYDLGTGAQVENHLFEVVGQFAYHLGPTVKDVDVSQVVRSVLVDLQGGAGYPVQQLGDWTAWSNYCCAAGLLVSPVLDQQVEASEVLRMAADLTNTAVVATDGVLKMVPYADSAEAGNGRVFTPNTTPLYQLDDDCYTPSGDGGSPILVRLKSPAQRFNHWRVEFLNRATFYAPEIAEAEDLADIDAHGRRTAPTLQAHWICQPEVARKVAQIKLQRSLAVCAEYIVPLPENYALIEPAELLTLTDSVLQMDDLPVRVNVIEEQDDGGLVLTCEDYPAGTASAATYPSQHGSGFSADYNVAPGVVDTPVIFEAPAQLAGSTGLEVYTAVRGGSTNWGGCQVWVSLDGNNYRQVGSVYGGSRYGTLSAAAAANAASLAVQGVNGGQLISGSAADATALATLCFVGGANPEYLAYQGATLTGPGAYTLTGLVHGAYGVATGDHASGAPFVRVDASLGKSGPLDVDMVGKTITFKFCSFNIFGQAVQSLTDAQDYPYVITGRMAALVPGIAGKGVKLRANALAFQYPKAGGVNPAAITLTLERKGVLQGAATWSVQSGTVVLAGTGDSRTIDPATLTTETATVRVAVTDAVATYLDEVTIAKVREGQDGQDGQDGLDGANAPLLVLLTTAQAFTFGTGGAAVPASQVISFTAQLGNLAGTATFTCRRYNASGVLIDEPTLGGSGNTRTLTEAQFGAAQFAVVSASLAGHSDQATVVRLRDGTGGVNAVLTNESVTVAADSAGNVASFASAGGTFRVWEGSVEKTGVGIAYSVQGGSVSGVTISIDASTGVYTVTGMSADTGTATLLAVYAGVTYDRVYSISKSRAGNNGGRLVFSGANAGPVTYSLIT